MSTTKKVAASMLKIATDPNPPGRWQGRHGLASSAAVARSGRRRVSSRSTTNEKMRHRSLIPSKFTYEERQMMRAMIERIAAGGEGEPLKPEEELPVIEG